MTLPKVELKLETKLELDLKKGALETDIKSLKKAARQTIGPELEKRIQSIIDTGLIELNNDFKIYWNECIQRLKNRNLVSLNSLLENLDPIAIGDFQYEITVSNKIQSDLFLTEKGAINQHLRTSLNNHNIDFKITINQDLTANKPYTTSEKFKAMADKKPILLSLKDKLGLDSEY